MLGAKRVIVATVGGIVFGFVCLGLASSGPVKPPLPVALEILTSRTLIGLAIGISAWSLGHWTIHGLVMGLLFSVPLGIGAFMAPENAKFSRLGMFIATLVLGMIYGLLIELITTVIFKAPRRAAAPGVKRSEATDLPL
jgi:hypothetical protein